MAINSFDELMKVVEERQNDVLTLELDMGGSFSLEHEEAKTRLKQAEAMRLMTGQSFLSDDIELLKKEVEDTRPEPNLVFLKFRRIKAAQWAALMKQSNLTNPVDQFEKVLPDTFIGIFGTDNADEVPLSADPKLISSKSDHCIVPGGALQSIIQAFMSWQNSGGEVTFHPTKSGQDLDSF